ncbi:hypothetical protein ScPMuIL_012354 [Solemya velum]
MQALAISSLFELENIFLLQLKSMLGTAVEWWWVPLTANELFSDENMDAPDEDEYWLSSPEIYEPHEYVPKTEEQREEINNYLKPKYQLLKPEQATDTTLID